MNNTAEKLTVSFPSVSEFESLTLDPEAFCHEAHVYVAWQLLQESEAPLAAERFTSALRRLVHKHGIDGKYHETISWFYVLLIAERQANQQHADWDAFAQANPDLTGSSLALLETYYSTERLWSRLARRQFLLPDRAIGTG